MTILSDIYKDLVVLSNRIGNGASVELGLVKDSPEDTHPSLLFRVSWENNFHIQRSVSPNQVTTMKYADDTLVNLAISAYEANERKTIQQLEEQAKTLMIVIPPLHPHFELEQSKLIPNGPTHMFVYEEEDYTYVKLWNKERSMAVPYPTSALPDIVIVTKNTMRPVKSMEEDIQDTLFEISIGMWEETSHLGEDNETKA